MPGSCDPLGSARVRSIAIGLIGIVLLLIFAVCLGGPLLDEMPLLALALWGLVVAGAAYVARLEPAQRRRL
jgi:hypothetical protein